MQVVKVNENHFIEGSAFYDYLEPNNEYLGWIKKHIVHLDIEENKDFFNFVRSNEEFMSGWRNRIVYLTLAPSKNDWYITRYLNEKL